MSEERVGQDGSKKRRKSRAKEEGPRTVHGRVDCSICGRIFGDRKALSLYVSGTHKKRFEDYVLEHELGGVRPLCKCGCGQETRCFGGKFGEWIRNHQCRGVPKSEEHRAKIGAAHRGRKLSEEHRENIGKTLAENFQKDPSHVEKMNAAVRGTKQTDEHRRKISETRSARLASGEIVINRDKISATMAQKYVDGDFDWMHGHHDSPKTFEPQYHRSSYELCRVRPV